MMCNWLTYYWCVSDLPINGTESAAFGVDSANNNSKTKKATNIFIPEKQKY